MQFLETHENKAGAVLKGLQGTVYCTAHWINCWIWTSVSVGRRFRGMVSLFCGIFKS